MADPLKKERPGVERGAVPPMLHAPESVPAPEIVVEIGKEHPPAQMRKAARVETFKKPAGAASVPRVALTEKKDPVQAEVELILAEDIEELFRALPQNRQEKFNTRGDEVAVEIFGMIARAKASAKFFFKLIRAWLTMIPGINRFFLEQEAKIKTDKLMSLAEREKEKKRIVRAR